MSRVSALPMSREVGVVALLICAVLALHAHLPRNVAAGDLLAAAATFLLLQGFVRDIARRRAAAVHGPEARKVTCVCVESVVGMGAIVAGLALSLAWAGLRVRVGLLAWAVGAAGVGAFGIAMREVVFDWRERRFRREADHGASVVWRR